jgi:membrane protease YdiL (CAAX protease family)
MTDAARTSSSPRVRALLLAAAVGVASMGCAAVVGEIVRAQHAIGGLPRWLVDRSADLVCSVLIVYTILVRGARRSPESLGLRVTRGTAMHAAIGTGAGAATALACFVVAWLARGYTVASAPATLHPDARVVIAFVILVATGAAFEEVAFRAGMVGAMLPAYRPAVAVIVPALPFALAHVFNPHASAAGIANVALAGALLGVLYIDPAGRPSTPSLGLCTGWHAGWNLTVAMLGIPVSGIDATWRWLDVRPRDELFSGGAFGIEAGLGTSIVLAVMVAALGFRARARSSAS